MHQVSTVSCNSYKNEDVRKALEASLKNLNFKFKKGMKVLIKPNILSPHPPEKAITTHPAVIEELCKILKKYNAEIYIGESSSYNTSLGFEISGIVKLKKYSRIINFEGQDKEFFDFSSIKNVPLPKILFEVDLIINIAKLKTHIFTGATLCVKNLYGCIPGKLKSRYHKLLKTPRKFSKFLLELEEKINPQLNIIEGIIGLEGNGPGTSGKPIESKVIIAGKNATATDIIASECMGFDPYSIYTNKFSNIKKEEIKVIGKISSLHFKKPLNRLSLAVPVFHIVDNLFPKPKIHFDPSKCSKCSLCAKKCPINAIELAPFPKCNYKKCIRCLCCVEICPNGAVSLRDHWTKEFVKKNYHKLLGL